MSYAMQYTAKGTVDGGYVNKERLRLRLRRARTVSASKLAELHAVRTAVDTRVSDADRSVTVLEDRQHKADRQRRVAARCGSRGAQSARRSSGGGTQSDLGHYMLFQDLQDPACANHFESSDESAAFDDVPHEECLKGSDAAKHTCILALARSPTSTHFDAMRARHAGGRSRTSRASTRRRSWLKTKGRWRGWRPRLRSTESRWRRQWAGAARRPQSWRASRSCRCGSHALVVPSCVIDQRRGMCMPLRFYERLP